MTHRITRAATAGLMALAVAATAAGPATAQGLPALPAAPEGAIGELLAPLEDLLGEITGPLGDALGDVPFDNAVRLLGDDAVAAAVALSRITFDDSRIAFIGRDDVFADTLSSVAGQGIAGAPLLLTQTDAVDTRTTEELQRLGVTEVIILGSTDAISEAVEADLVATYGAAAVSRVGGPSRIETAADLASELAPAADRVVMLRAYPSEGADEAQAYADALSAGPLASGLELPSLLTTAEYLHPATEAYLESAGVREVTIVGGEAAVGPDVELALTDMGITVTRIAGVNRWDTSILVARALGMLDASDANRIILTEGGGSGDPLWAPGFAAAAHGAVFQSPVILADGPLLPPETISWIADGLISNALRLSNEPIICNSFVDFLACETAALLTVGALDEANALTGGQLGDVLGVVLEPLREALEGVIPGPGEMGPGLLGQILGLIGLSGEEEPVGEECAEGDEGCEGGTSSPTADARYATAMASQPAEVSAAFDRLVGAEGARTSPSTQAVLIDLLAGLSVALGGPVDTGDPAQAAALVAVLDGITSVLGSRSGDAPLGALTQVLEGVEGLVGDLVDASALADVVGVLGTDTDAVVGGLVGQVTGLLATGAEVDLVDAYGERARPLADAIARISG